MREFSQKRDFDNQRVNPTCKVQIDHKVVLGGVENLHPIRLLLPHINQGYWKLEGRRHVYIYIYMEGISYITVEALYSGTCYKLHVYRTLYKWSTL